MPLVSGYNVRIMTKFKQFLLQLVLGRYLLYILDVYEENRQKKLCFSENEGNSVSFSDYPNNEV